MSPPLHERAKIEQAGHGIEIDEAMRLRALLAVPEVGGDTHVREQSRILKHVADTAALRRYIDAPLRIEQHVVIQRHPADVGIEKPGDDVDQGALAAAGAAEQRHHAGGRQFECGLQREGATALPDGDAEHQRPRSVRTRRANHSDNISPPNPRTNEMHASRAAAASPPGVCNAA